MKRVVRLKWGSFDGRVEFRPIYDDRTVGAWTPTDFETNDPCYRDKVVRIAQEEIGKEV